MIGYEKLIHISNRSICSDIIFCKRKDIANVTIKTPTDHFYCSSTDRLVML